MGLVSKLGALAAAAVPAAPDLVRAAGLEVKPGDGDMKMTSLVGGAAQLPHTPTPEREARLEAAFKNCAAAPHAIRYKGCATREDPEDGQPFQKDQRRAFTIKSRTARRGAGPPVCRRAMVSSQGGFEMRASGREDVAMTGNGTLAYQGNASGPTDSRPELTGHWASPSCKGYGD
jgi:hypothetical protein